MSLLIIAIIVLTYLVVQKNNLKPQIYKNRTMDEENPNFAFTNGSTLDSIKNIKGSYNSD